MPATRPNSLSRVATALLFLPALIAGAFAAAGAQEDRRWWGPGQDRTWPETLDYPNANGVLRTVLAGGPIETAGHPFFAPLGPNGRACVSCHQPGDAMSLSVETIRDRWQATGGRDPIFAAIDGSNCPSPQGAEASHSMLLEHGVFRIERPWPVTEFAGRPVTPDFEIEVVRDPHGCNSGDYGPDRGRISVYRRPRPVANMKYLVATGFAYDPKQGLALPRDPDDGSYLAGNLMSDNRAVNLRLQMEDAGRSHLQFMGPFAPEVIERIRAFELSVFTAQQRAGPGVELDSLGALGGPAVLRDSRAGALGSQGVPVFSEFAAWEDIAPEEAARMPPAELEWRRSVARGARVFRERDLPHQRQRGDKFADGLRQPGAQFLRLLPQHDAHGERRRPGPGRPRHDHPAVRRSDAGLPAVSAHMQGPAAPALRPGHPDPRSGLRADDRPLRRCWQDYPAIDARPFGAGAVLLERLGARPARRDRLL